MVTERRYTSIHPAYLLCELGSGKEQGCDTPTDAIVRTVTGLISL